MQGHCDGERERVFEHQPDDRLLQLLEIGNRLRREVLHVPFHALDGRERGPCQPRISNILRQVLRCPAASVLRRAAAYPDAVGEECARHLAGVAVCLAVQQSGQRVHGDLLDFGAALENLSRLRPQPPLGFEEERLVGRQRRSDGPVGVEARGIEIWGGFEAQTRSVKIYVRGSVPVERGAVDPGLVVLSGERAAELAEGRDQHFGDGHAHAIARRANVLVGVPLDGTAVARGAGAGGGARLVDGEAGGHDGLKQREWNEKNAGLYIYMDVLTSGGKK